MNMVQTAPGPDAAKAFRLGILVSALIGIIVIGALYWKEIFTPIFTGYALFVLFPVYLVFAATALSVWLGYTKDTSSLRPVYKEKDSANQEN